MTAKHCEKEEPKAMGSTTTASAASHTNRDCSDTSTITQTEHREESQGSGPRGSTSNAQETTAMDEKEQKQEKQREKEKQQESKKKQEDEKEEETMTFTALQQGTAKDGGTRTKNGTHGDPNPDAEALPLPTLARGVGLTTQSQPGAFREGNSVPEDETQTTVDATGTDTGTDSGTGRPNPNQDDEGLVEAKPVQEEQSSVEDLEEARPMVSNPPKLIDHPNANKAVWALLFIAVLAVTLIVTLSVVFTQRKGKGNANTTDATETETPQDILQEFCLDENQNAQVAHLKELLPPDLMPISYDPCKDNSTYTPQEHAFHWLANDPSLSQYTLDRAIQRFALATLYMATNGSEWNDNSGWLSYDIHECDWYAEDIFLAFFEVEVSDYPCHEDSDLYKKLWLTNNNLVGFIPDEIYSMTSLTSVQFLWNPELAGTISPKIHQLQNLDKVSFTMNHMRGTIPTEVGLLTNLRLLYLTTEDHKEHKLTGTLPVELEQLTLLEQLTFAFNDISGSIPSNIGRLSHIYVTGWYGTHLTGTIPTEIGLLTDMKYLYVRDNPGISGTIPTEIGLMTVLKSFMAYNMDLTGTIPSELGVSPSLIELALSNNTLEGTLPSELGQLSSVYMMYFSHNPDLTGTIPVEFENLNITVFDVSETSITGDIPLFLQEAQDDLSFERFYFECKRMIPCPDEDTNTVFDGKPNED